MGQWKSMVPSALALTAVLLFSLSCVRAAFPLERRNSHDSWIDPDTPEDAYTKNVPNGPHTMGQGGNFSYHLIFSDEFQDNKRKFEAGYDRKWTAIDQRDISNMGQHYFLPQAVQVDKKNLVITTTKPHKRYRGAKYVSGSLQTWNKFCFTGGFVEVKAILPGKWGIPGTWPAMWIMGNIGRAAYLGSQDGTWPWSFDYCGSWVEIIEDVHQRISACGNLTDKKDPNSYPEHYGLNPFQGRGATEIDIMEAQIRAKDKPAMISTSLQIRPALYSEMRPASGDFPKAGQWYQNLSFGNYTRINSDYYGDDGLDSISALTQLEPNSFTDYHLYQLDWSPGPEGYIRWWLDGNFLFEIPGSSLSIWVGNLPPRMVPVEPSYLILSTAVSEKFSPPCSGQICDSIWPSNFTIDYVRVYQGNPNRFTSIGCDPPRFPTKTWIFSHPVDYGLPWYVSLRIDVGSLHAVAIVNLVIAAFIMFLGYQHPRSSAAYAGIAFFTASLYAIFSVGALEQLAWIHAAIAILAGIVFGGLCSLDPLAALGGLLGAYVAVAFGQVFSSILWARILMALLIAAGVVLGFRASPKYVIVISTSALGALGASFSISLWVNGANFAMNTWQLVGFLLGGTGYVRTEICSAHCDIMYTILVGLTIGALAFQFYQCRGISVARFIAPGNKKSSQVTASSDARAWKPDDVALDRVNFFSPKDLPAKMQQFKAIFKIAHSVQQSFGFQIDNFRNQTEHVVMLLTNYTRKGQNPYRGLHTLVFGNYRNWCRKLHVPVACWYEDKHPHGYQSSVQEISVDLCLFFFIWGEASNFRHTPEFLCFLFHKMKEEYPSIRTEDREPGYFLDTVITPVYNLMRAQMGSRHDHQDRHNYDDFNEMFWDPSCLSYDYKYEDVYDCSSPNPMASFRQQRQGLPQPSIRRDRSDSRKSIAEAFAESSKPFLEKRSWLMPLRAFRRVFDFHVIAFHFLVTLAFTREQEMDFLSTLRLVSSVMITPFLLTVLSDALALFASYDPRNTKNMIRYVVQIVFHLSLTTITLTLYWYAWSYGGDWWTTYYVSSVILHIPGLLNCLLQVLPQLTNWLRRTEWKPVAIIRDFISPMNRLYVGDNVLDPASLSVGYQVYWVSMISWKMFFSYKFEIYPLVIPSFLLWADHVENKVSVITTSFLIFLQWFPFFLIFCIDITIWNSIWVAFTGTFVGFSSRIGEIRNFKRVRAAFSRAADAFNSKIIAARSKTGALIAETLSYTGSYGSIGNEVLDRVVDESVANRNPTDQTPLLSFSRRRQTAEEVKRQRRQKWFSFSVAWDTVIDAMRADDLICNAEKALLQFQRVDGYQREIYLPQFQLAGCFETLTSNISDIYTHEQNLSERLLQDKLLDLLGENLMLEEAIEEIWELAVWVLINVLGPCHTNDVRHICSTLHSWATRGVFRALNLQRVGPCGKALADLLSLLKSNMGSWKSSAKFVPVRKNPSDYSSYQFPQGNMRPTGGGMTKSASTTGLSSLGGTVPRRSRGSGVARIAAMQQAGKSKELTGKSAHSISTAHITQVRDKLRTFLNLAKSALAQVEERDPVYAESKAISDRLTWILTQERGIMWDDDYTGEQITLTAFERNADTIVKHLHGLLTLQKIDAEPRSFDARRRLLFFVNSLFMDMPLAPLLEEMKSYSVMTPFYGEDVLYSKHDLESKQDGLDVHTLLFLQTLYKKDWENFLERVKPKKNLWKDPDVAMELRLWASLRGQTLARTVQGMMYGEAAIRLLAEIEQVPVERIEELVKTKFTYVVACQIYGRQKRNNDPKARDIEYLLHRFPNLRVAYIDEVRVNYQKEQSYFAVLIKGGDELGKVEEVYRVRLPGNPILGEGKPENQNSAIIFTRGENLQTIDMNQDGYVEEALKMRNMLEEFDSGSADRPYTIVGLPEHIFTGSVSSLANYMALQETSFVTLGQRTLARPLRVRLHYGHPDVFNKLFFITRGGISKASKGINLSEDIFAGYNNCLRGGSVTFPEYIKCGKGRDVGMQQIYKFEAKLAQGAAEQSLSRDVYRISQRLDFFKLLSFYYNHVGFYLSMSLIIWTVYILLYCNLIRALLSLEGVGGRTPVILSHLQVMMGSVAFFTTAPLFATISVERGFKAAIKEVLMIFVTGGPLYFLFHIGTKWFYFGQTILAGGAKYRATGRGFVTKHSRFDELYRFYASSHLYAGVEIAAGLIIFYMFSIGQQYFATTWSLWLVVASWTCSPFWFNPLAFEWSDVVEDMRVWFKWMRGDGGNADQSWEAWFKEENAYFSSLRPWAKACVTLKGVLFTVIALSIVSTGDPYHSLLKERTWIPFSICFGLAFFYFSISGMFFKNHYGESGTVRFLKLILVIVTATAFVVAFVYVDGMLECLISIYYIGAAIGCWLLLIFGSNSRYVGLIYYIHDAILGIAFLGAILVLSALYVPGKIQTWLLYNNALSRGVVIEDILRANTGHEEREDELSLQQMRSIIIEQQRVISALAGSGSDSDERAGTAGSGTKKDLVHTLSDNALQSLRNVSESELSALYEASKRLQAIVNEADNKADQAQSNQEPKPRVRRAHSSSDYGLQTVSENNGRPPFSQRSHKESK